MLNASIWLPEHGHEAWVLVFGQIRFYHGSEWCSCICKRCPAQSAKSYGDCDCEMNRTQSKWLNTSQLLQGTVSHSSITAAEALHHLGTEEDWWSEWSFPGGVEGAGELAGGGGGAFNKRFTRNFCSGTYMPRPLIKHQNWSPQICWVLIGWKSEGQFLSLHY